MNTIKRGIKFISRYALSHPRYVFWYLRMYRKQDFQIPISLLGESEVALAVRSGKSIIRIGDGEINLLLGLQNHYQTFSRTLQICLRNIIKEYVSESPYILSVPRFVSVSNEELKHMNKFNVWMPLKVAFYLWFNKTVPYMDAHNFYYDGYFERVVAPELAGKHVILITKSDTIKKVQSNSDMPWRRMLSVTTPEQEALGCYDQLKKQIWETINGTPTKDVVLLFALGPVGKCLAYYFARNNVQSVDIGKVAEVMFTGRSIEHII